MITRVYELYPRLGTFMVQTIHYRGTAYFVAATSVRQAYAVAHKNIRIDPTDPYPVGIVSITAAIQATRCGAGARDIILTLPCRLAGQVSAHCVRPSNRTTTSARTAG